MANKVTYEPDEGARHATSVYATLDLRAVNLVSIEALGRKYQLVVSCRSNNGLSRDLWTSYVNPWAPGMGDAGPSGRMSKVSNGTPL